MSATDMSSDQTRSQFDKLREKYLVARKKFFDHESALSSKYGPRHQKSWLNRTEEKRLDQLCNAANKAGDAMYAYICKISPRDWNSGVPIHWIYEHLSFDDAVRPINEKLSAVPPLSYGATHHVT